MQSFRKVLFFAPTDYNTIMNIADLLELTIQTKTSSSSYANKK